MMNKLSKSLLAAVALVVAVTAGYTATRYAGNALFSETALAYTKTSDVLNTDELNNLSLQAVISSYVPVAQTVFDGQKSTMSIAVSSYSALASAQASVRITIASNTALGGHSVTINGTRYLEGTGGQWFKTATASNTAIALAAALDANSSYDASASSNVVYATMTVAGSYGNSFTCVSSTAAALICSAATFTGGQDAARLAVNGVVLDAGTHYTVATSSSVTAKAISDAMMAIPSLAAIFTSTWNANGIVTATAAAVGVNAYTLFTSTPAALRLNGSSTTASTTFLNGLASDVVSNTWTKANHGFTTGLDVKYNTVTGTAPQNLINNTTYFVIRDGASTFRVATTRALATATTPTAVVTSTVTGLGSFTFTPLVLTGSPVLKIQISNDDTNWSDLSVTTVTFISPYTSTTQFWDLGMPAYKSLRLSYIQGTAGGVALTVTANGRTDR